MSEARKPALLLLDDDATLRDVLQRRLAAAGYVVVAVASIDEAMRAAQGRHFAALMIDRHIGSESGVDALHALRACTGARRARAIALTADLDESIRALLAGAGFDASLQKPVAIADLLGVIDDAAFSESTAMPPPPRAEPLLDDAAAFAIWGATDTVRQLRAMLIVELDDYRAALQDCASVRDGERLHGVLHRMRSSAGFCGAVHLNRFIDASMPVEAAWDDLLERYDAMAARLKPALQAALAT